VTVGAGLVGGDLGGLQRRCHHHQPVAVLRQQVVGRAQGRGLPGARGSFDHHELPVAGQDPDHGSLGRVDPDQTAPPDAHRPGG
jgi:hypothetical protein